MENPENNKKRQRRKLVLQSLDSSDEIGLKRKRVETTGKTDDQLKKCCSEEEEMKSLGGEETQNCELKLENILGVCKTKCVELLAELEKKTMECVGIQGKLAELESMKIAAEDELKEFKRRQERRRSLEQIVWGRTERRTRGRVTYLEGELKRMEKDMEHEKKTAQGEVQFWRSKVCDLEARVLRMENGSVESRVSEPRGGLRNDAPHNGEREGDSELSKRDTEVSGGRRCSRVCELQTKDNVVNEDEVDVNKHRQVQDEVAECPAMSISYESPDVACRGQKGEDVNGKVERASVYESSSENHLGLSAKLPDKVGNTAAMNSVDLVCLDSDGESAGEASKGSSDCSSDSKSLGEVMDMMAMKYRNKVRDLKWDFEADMLSSFEEDPELCMKAVCALYRQQTIDEKSGNGVFHNFDALRIKNLAEFLMEGDHKGDLKKSVKELELFTSKALEDCKRLASSYSKQLFSIYKDKQDPFFLPTSTASH